MTLVSGRDIDLGLLKELARQCMDLLSQMRSVPRSRDGGLIRCRGVYSAKDGGGVFLTGRTRSLKESISGLPLTLFRRSETKVINNAKFQLDVNADEKVGTNV